MAFIVAEPCIKCKYTDCVTVCPVDCFHEGANFLVIDPDTCIDCGACVPECPTKAIFDESDLPDKWKSYVEINARYTKDWPVISEKREGLPEAKQYDPETGDWKDKPPGSKDALLDPTPGAGS